MAYLIESGIQVSLTGANGTWQKLTDHNRQAIQIDPELIESQSRMANGKMRKYVIAQKNKISVSWKYVPSKQSEAVDGFFSAAWIESSELDPDPAFGVLPAGTFATAQTGSKVYNVYMTNFSKTIINRTKISDYVDMSIEFTEI